MYNPNTNYGAPPGAYPGNPQNNNFNNSVNPLFNSGYNMYNMNNFNNNQQLNYGYYNNGFNPYNFPMGNQQPINSYNNFTPQPAQQQVPVNNNSFDNKNTKNISSNIFHPLQSMESIDQERMNVLKELFGLEVNHARKEVKDPETKTFIPLKDFLKKIKEQTDECLHNFREVLKNNNYQYTYDIIHKVTKIFAIRSQLFLNFGDLSDEEEHNGYFLSDFTGLSGYDPKTKEHIITISVGPDEYHTIAVTDEEVNEAAKAMSGMQNIGATCYFNTAWQILVNNPVFFAHCLKIAKDDKLLKKLIDYQTDPKIGRLLEAFFDYILEYEKGKLGTSVKESILHKLKEAVARIDPSFEGINAHDANALYRTITGDLFQLQQ